MPCPNCGKNINYLICDEWEHNAYHYNGQPGDILWEEATVEFICPECGEVVAEDFSKADEILGIIDDLYREGDVASTG
jgi:predicted RNA-binding Zn-ribbon protein involved in translation (DUF1610 family)